jgi:hypothetical protein
MLAMVMARRCLPSPLRLATILVVAGAQTGHALAPPVVRPPTSYPYHSRMPSIAVAAAMGAVAGSMLTQRLHAEPTFSFGSSSLRDLPSEFAFLGNDINCGTLHGNLLIDSAQRATWLTAWKN